MRYLSVCSGIEAATVAWKPLGWSAVAFSEIERFPNAVLEHHYPDVPNWGDMNDFQGWSDANVDLLVGGTPCQSFSIAGLGKGMADPRGRLALVYLAIAERYRPRWLVWENVPRVLSINGGRDFGSILGGMVKLGYGFAYRVLDAQFCGVPQRRRRVFVVGYLGDWRRAAAVLFEPQSLRRNPPPSREAGQKPAPTLASRSKAGGGLGSDFEIDGGLVARPLKAGGNLRHDESLVVHGTQDPCVQDDVAFSLGRNTGQENAVAFAQNQREEVRELEVAGAIAAIRRGDAKNETIIAFKAGQGSKAGSLGESSEVSPTLGAAESGTNRVPALAAEMAVRRLTPLECTRLQGFPDDYFDEVPSRSDSAVYKALGNTIAIPPLRWIGERISAQTEQGK